MGIAQAGLAFRRTAVLDDLQAVLSALSDEDATKIEHPDAKDFDIRNHGDVMVQFFDDVCFVCNHDLVWPILEHQKKDLSKLHKVLGAPDQIVAFCHYESGGSYGYSFVQNGKRIRSRLQTTGVPSLPPILESGTPQDFERLWLSAKYYLEEDDCPTDQRQKIFYQGEREVEIPEYFLTSRILYEGLLRQFSICPWETDLQPEYHFFKLSERKRAWWRLW